MDFPVGVFDGRNSKETKKPARVKERSEKENPKAEKTQDGRKKEDIPVFESFNYF